MAKKGSDRSRTKVYWVFGLGVVVAFIGLLQIETTGNIVDDLPKDHPIVDDLHWFESNFGGVVPFEIQVDAGKPKQIMNPVLLKKMEEVSTAFEGDPSFSRSISIVDALKFVRQAFYNGNPDRYDLISSRERAFFKITLRMPTLIKDFSTHMWTVRNNLRELVYKLRTLELMKWIVFWKWLHLR